MRLSALGRLARLGLLPALLLATAPTPASAVATLRTAGRAVDASAPLVAGISLMAWGLLGWLVLVAAGLWVERLPGRGPRRAAVVLAVMAPLAVRRVVAFSLGLSVAAAVGTASPAIAGSGTHDDAGPRPRPPASLDWPSATAAPELDWNPPAPVHSAPRAGFAAVAVRPGDSLWAIAAEHLPAGATTASIAQTWPAWWSANREAVGADPDLIHPGLLLTPPDPS
jgi:hypothetical protein